MVRSAVVVIFLGVACAAIGDDKNPVREKLFAARGAYDAEMREFRKVAGEWFDKREEAARKDDNKKLLDQIKTERKAFEEDCELPRACPLDIRLRPEQARKTLEGVYAQAIKDCIRSKKDEVAAAVEAAWRAIQAEHTIDVLALADPNLHSVGGVWKRDGKALVNTAAELTTPRLQFPYEPGREYDVEVTCRRVEGKACIGIGLVSGGDRALATIDEWPSRGYMYGFERVDNKRLADSPMRGKGALLKADKDNTIACSVRDRRIELSVNGRAVASFQGDFSRFSVDAEHSVPNKKSLFLVIGPNTSFRIERVVVTPVNGWGTVLK